MSKHQKHTNLVRRNNGIYANNEISILGVKCSIISDLVYKIAKKNQKKAKIAYLDASHSDTVESPILDTFTFHHSGNLDLNSKYELNKFNARIQLAQYDLVCINGNHYQGEKQVLILDNEKEASVKKRVHQLTNVQFVIKMSPESNYFDFLENAIPNIKELPCYAIDDIEKISNHLGGLIESNIPDIQGLVLAGGQSTRMGADKGLLEYHGISQREFLYQIFQDLFPRKEEGQLGSYYSVRQHQDISGNSIVDKFKGLGPFGGICSAFQENPNTAWLVIATDVPFVSEEKISLLLKHRNPSKIATTFKGKNKEFPEPLITIWEPKAYPLLLQYLSQGYSCPRKVLINSDVEIVEIEDDFIRNINTPQEFEEAKKELK
ncbi:molybdenum cofactor guanylyltransferase [Urechidicola vernalis]|uniref:Probable molybdenum cofactor guanylyltransferase n=1 Tax=Urechidicola vernalis TaxID=3075600 RepID=A0ABU2YA97_9FLAO|nr:NTP transferase domain-containing protein [Urechidicola sp. P050]MDT0553993.1 NTP transferase domain-containing protein [Urechidicola sp. P050]